MEIDVHSLATYNELARAGGEAAADALAGLADVEARVEVTGVSLLSPADLAAEFADREFAGVRVELGDPLAGETALVFDEVARRTITRALVPTEDPERVESAIVEVGNILANGFVGGWADHLGTRVETSPPTYHEGSGRDVLPTMDATGGDRLLVFRSRVTAEAAGVDFRLLLVPTVEAFENLLADPSGEGPALETLEVFAEMTRQGATRAATNVGTMTGLDATVSVNRLHFTSVEDIQRHVGDDHRVGAVVGFRGTPGGHLLILFDPESAMGVVEALLRDPVDGAWTDTERGALEELCNLIASGFVDGWANVLQTSIKHRPPSFVADMGASIVSPIVATVARQRNDAFLLDSSIATADGEDVQCDIFAIPDPEGLEAALDDLDVDRVAETRADPDALF